MIGDQKDIDQLTQRSKLNNGGELSYASGIVSDTYKGWKQFSHAGGDAGYRTYLTVFPDLKMGFIVFSNLGDSGPWDRAYEIASLFISDTTKENVAEVSKRKDNADAFVKDSIKIKKFTGRYISDDGTEISFHLANKEFYANAFGRSFRLVQGAKDTFSSFNDPKVKFSFSTSNAGDTTLFAAFSGDEKRLLKKYIADTSQPDKLLKSYTGTYYCPELDCKYEVTLKDHHLLLTNNKYNDVRLTLTGPDHLFSDFWWMNHLVVIRNNKKEITGFEVNSGRIMHLRFNKIQ